MDNNLQIVTTADGSKTIYNTAVGEHYHSKNGALQESQHVFVNAGLICYLTENPVCSLRILEVGFGTGLNFLLSAGYCTAKQVSLDYTGVEAYPLEPALLGQTGYEQFAVPEIWQALLNNYLQALRQQVSINEYCTLAIAHYKLLDYTSDQRFDVIYFDAFASLYQPEMWNLAAIGHAISLLGAGGIFVTYAITGNLKRMLKGMGLTVEQIPGAAGKREMLRARKPRL